MVGSTESVVHVLVRFVFLFGFCFCFVFSGPTLRFNGQTSAGRGWCFHTSDRHALKAPFIRVFSGAFPFPGSTPPLGLPPSRAHCLYPCDFTLPLVFGGGGEVPGHCSENNPNECVSVWEAGGRAGTGWEAAAAPAAPGGGGLRDSGPSLSLPPFPWVESGLVDTLVARSLRVPEKPTHEAWPCTEGWSNSPCIPQLPPWPHAGDGAHPGPPGAGSPPPTPPPGVGGAFPRREDPAASLHGAQSLWESLDFVSPLESLVKFPNLF